MCKHHFREYRGQCGQCYKLLHHVIVTTNSVAQARARPEARAARPSLLTRVLTVQNMHLYKLLQHIVTHTVTVDQWSSQHHFVSISFVTIITFLHSLKEQFGRGQFGIVHRGIWRGEPEVQVAVKSMEGSAVLEERVKFLQEAAIMGQFKHPYILRVLGILTGENVSSRNVVYVHADMT